MPTDGVFAFQRPGPGGWGNQERADVFRVIDQLARRGVYLEASSGVSEEGDPWFALEDAATGDVILHVARLDGIYVAHVLDGDSWHGQTLRDALAGLPLDEIAAAAGDISAGAETSASEEARAGAPFLRVVSAILAAVGADALARSMAGGEAFAAHSPLASDPPSPSAAPLDPAPWDGEALPSFGGREPSRQHAPDGEAKAVPLPEAKVPELRVAHGSTLPSAGALPSGGEPPPVQKEQVLAAAGGDLLVPAPSARGALMPLAAAGVAADAGPLATVAFGEGGLVAQAGPGRDTFIVRLVDGRGAVAVDIQGFAPGEDALIIEQRFLPAKQGAVDGAPVPLPAAAVLADFGQPASGNPITTVAAPPVLPPGATGTGSVDLVQLTQGGSSPQAASTGAVFLDMASLTQGITATTPLPAPVPPAGTSSAVFLDLSQLTSGGLVVVGIPAPVEPPPAGG